MMDFMFEKATFSGIIIYLFIYLCILGKYYSSNLNPTCLEKKHDNSFLLLFFFICLSVFCFLNSDFFNYQEIVKYYDFSIGAINHGEPIYGFLTSLVCRNYFLFRVIVWGGASILTYLVFRRFKIEPYYAIFFLLATDIKLFSYSRAILAMAIYFFGLSFFCRPTKKKLWGNIAGLLIIILSYQFHHSMIILIFMVVFLFFPLNQYTLILGFLLVPLIAYQFSDIFYYLLDSDSLEIDDVTRKASLYGEREASINNLTGLLHNGIVIGLTYYQLFLIGYCLCFKKLYIAPSYNEMWISFRNLYKITFAILALAAVFLFSSIEASTFYVRVMRMSMIPLIVLVVGLRQMDIISKKKYNYILIIGFLSQLWSFLYVLKSA